VQETGIVRPYTVDMNKYWDSIGKAYDKVIQLNGVVEADLLRVEGDPRFYDPWEKRNIECNRNYIDNHFIRAGLDIKGRLPAVALTNAEIEFARNEVEQIRKKLGRQFIVLWNIFGSAWHKAYPWMFDVWQLIKMNKDNMGILAVSDDMGKYVVGKEFSDIVYNGCNRYKFRQSLSLHSAVDAVVTPETWSLTAAQAFPAPLVALLSHSSPSNFPSRKQDTFLYPKKRNCDCYPCHQLHHARSDCPRGTFNKDATLCMDQIEPGDVYDCLIKALRSGNGYHA
jgi:hypothetical protein